MVGCARWGSRASVQLVEIVVGCVLRVKRVVVVRQGWIALRVVLRVLIVRVVLVGMVVEAGTAEAVVEVRVQ